MNEPTKALALQNSKPPAKNGNGAGNGAKEWDAKHLRFIDWLASPFRKPLTHQELAKELDRHPTTLSDWKHEPGFTDAVITRTRELLRADDVPDILHSHAKLGRNSVKSATLVLKAANVLGDTHAGVTQDNRVVIINDGKAHDDAIDAISE